MSGSWWSTTHASLSPSPDIDTHPKRHSAGNQATSSWRLPSGRMRQIAAGLAARKVRFAPSRSLKRYIQKEVYPERVYPASVAPAGLGQQLKRDPRDWNANSGNKVGAKSTWSIPIERAGVTR